MGRGSMFETTLKVGPASFRIGSDWSEPIEHIEKLYRAYPKPSLVDFTVRLEAAKPWRRFIRPSVRIEGDYMLPNAVPLPLEQALLGAEMGLNLQMALGWRKHLILHASAAEKDGKSLIMTGESGSGKSTLSALLGQNGWRFMGDEFALIGHDCGRAFPYPRLISLKNQAIEAMQKESPNSIFGPLMQGTPKGDIRHMVPPIDSIRQMDVPAKPAMLLFPRFGYDQEIREVLPSETFIRLTQASTNYVPLGETGYNSLKRFIDETPVFAIDYNSGDEALSIIDELWART